MDKRYEPSKDYGRVNKKPKLEIIVGKGRSNQNALGGPSTSRYAAKQASPARSSPDDFWDDDDDEVLLMASQVVEKCSGGQTIQLSSQTREFTFSEFAPNVKSTQKYFERDVELFSEMDDDWDDGVVAVSEKPSLFQSTQKDAPVFKVPEVAVSSKRTHQESERTERPFSSDLPKSATPMLAQAAFNTNSANFNSAPISMSQPNSINKNSNREKAHECQIQFLQKRADTLKKENAKITKELDDFRNKMESKDGEVSLLRDEIRHLKQQIQNAQREKLQSSDVVKTEWQDKINELSKQVEAQQTVLEFKTMEISKLKMNHADETMRFENSMRDNLNESSISAAHQTNLRVTTSNRRRMTHVQCSARLNRRVPAACNIPIEIFDQSIEKGNSKFRKDVFHREMERLQFHMTRAQYIGQLKSNQKTELAGSVIESAKCVIAEFWTYVHSLEYNKHSHSLPHHSYDITKDSRQQTDRSSLFQAEVLFPSEKAINLRRYIAGLSIICKLVPEAGALLFTVHHNEYLLIQIIVDGLNKLGFSNEICQHFGVIESFAMLLDTLWDNHSEGDQDEEHLMSFLKTLVFCRPNAWASKFITLCLQKLSPTARDQLCGNSRSPNFSVSQVLYKFTTESCLLQVYACLLETAFPANQELSRSEFKLLSEICYNHVIFFTSCFPSPPRFVANILPHDDDVDEEGLMSQQPGVNVKCQCYVMMCSSVVKLLYQVMRQWQRMERQHEVKLIENIAKVGVRLLHTIYIRFYMTKLFDHKGYLTRHYLYFICKYWLDSMDLLQFMESHREALDQLASSHIVEIKSQPEQRNTSKVDRDLKRWYEHSGDVAHENMDCIDVDAEDLSDFMKLHITEKACKAELFFKRY
ncbi:ATR-interacting protein mus304 [Eupeodes corollae]|uniref:ATR-interacting protein mus304 n=1 Tax=Eupeodes corollae TaxID=290404 RepID=UPI0024933BC1|nr:ATR-interacting protein mus304 [Eupeodes corollae]